MDGIRVVRVWTSRDGQLRVSSDILGLLPASGDRRRRGTILPTPDVIVATSPQIFTALGGCILAWIKRRPFVFELRDLWPDSIVAVGAMREGLLLRMLRRLEYGLYHRAAKIVSVTHAFKRILVANGVPHGKIAVIRNGVDLAAFVPGPKPAELARRLGLEAGSSLRTWAPSAWRMGSMSSLSAAELLRDRGNLAFVLVGTGAERARLEQEAKRRGLDRVIFAGPVDKAEVKQYWRLCRRGSRAPQGGAVFHHVIPSEDVRGDGYGAALIPAPASATGPRSNAQREDDRPPRTHRLEHLRRNDVVKDRRLLEEHESHVAQPPILLYLCLVHRTGEYHAVQPRRLASCSSLARSAPVPTRTKARFPRSRKSSAADRRTSSPFAMPMVPTYAATNLPSSPRRRASSAGFGPGRMPPGRLRFESPQFFHAEPRWRREFA